MNRRDRGQALAVVGGITLYILFGLLLWWGLDRYIQPTSSTEKKDLMQTRRPHFGRCRRRSRHLLYLAEPAAHSGKFADYRAGADYRTLYTSTRPDWRKGQQGQYTSRDPPWSRLCPR